jgi:hypothetical protein
MRALPLALGDGTLRYPRGYTQGLHQSFWYAVRPCFAGLSRSYFIMAEREGYSPPIEPLAVSENRNHALLLVAEMPIG